MTLTFGSLFAGVGGFDLAFERAGLSCRWQAELDDDATAVLAKHWPGVPRFRDVRECGRNNLAPVDVITGGFPCQDLSVAGKRAGLGGERSGLFYEMVRVVDELRPAFLVWENVPGLLSSNRGLDFLAVLSELDRVGYCGAWTGLDARFFGLAQRRRRIFGVFARNDIGAARCAEILALRTRRDGHPPAGGEEGAGVAADTEDCSRSPGRDDAEDALRRGQPVTFDWQAGGSGDTSWRGKSRAFTVRKPGKAGSLQVNKTEAVAIPPVPLNGETAYSLPASARGTGDGHGQAWNTTYVGTPGDFVPDTAPALLARYEKGVNGHWQGRPADDLLVAHALTGVGHDASEDGTGRGTPLAVQAVQEDRQNGVALSDTAGTLRAGAPGRQPVGSLLFLDAYSTRCSCSPNQSPVKTDGCSDALDTTGPGAVAFHENQRAEVTTSDTAGSLKVGGGKPGQGYPAVAFGLKRGGGDVLEGLAPTLDGGGGGHGKALSIAAQMVVRRLTPVECERLQGFPYDWTAYCLNGGHADIMLSWQELSAQSLAVNGCSLTASEASASPITSVCGSTEVSIFRSESRLPSSPAGYVTGWLERTAPGASAPDTTSHGSDTVIRFDPSGTPLNGPPTPSAGPSSTDELWRLHLAGPSDAERLSTISTWMSAITRLRTCTPARTTPNTCAFTLRWNAPPPSFSAPGSFVLRTVAIRPISDSARYRCLGNAVAVPVVEWIARRLVMFFCGGTEAGA